MKVKIIANNTKEYLEKNINDFLNEEIKVISISYLMDHWYFSHTLHQEYSAVILYDN